jgi:hypothetical protein
MSCLYTSILDTMYVAILMAYQDNVTKYRRTKDTVAIESFGVVVLLLCLPPPRLRPY